MADKNVGKISTQIVANPAGVEEGVGQAEDMLKAAADRLGSLAPPPFLRKVEDALLSLPATAKGALGAVGGWFSSMAEGARAKWDNFLQNTNTGTALRWGANVGVGVTRFLGTTLPGLARSGFGALKGLATDAFSFMEDAFKNPAKFISDGLFGGAARMANMVPLVGPLLALPFEAIQGGMNFLLDTYKSGAAAILEMGDAAASVGTRVDDFQIWAKIAGGADNAKKAVMRFKTTLMDASMAGAGDRNPFTRLGLDARSLLAGGDREALKQYAEKFAGLKDRTLQAKAAFDLFGKSAPMVVRMLSKGRTFIEETEGKFEKYGLGMSEASVANVRKAALAGKELDMFWQGFKNQVATGVAPFLAEIADRIGSLPGGFGGFAETVVDGLSEAIMFVAYFVDAWGDQEAFWGSIGQYAKKGFAEIVDGIASVLKAAEEMAPKTIAATQGVWTGIKAALGLGGPKMMVNDAINGVFNPWSARLSKWAREKAAEADAKLKEYKDRVGIGEAQSAAQDFVDSVKARFKGASDEGLDVFMQMYQRVTERGAALEESLLGPWGALQKKLIDIRRLASEVVTDASGAAVSLLDTQFAGLRERAHFDIYKGLMAASGLDRALPKVGAMERGSREAYSTILQFQQGQAKADVQEQIRAALELQNEQQREEIRIGREVEKALRGKQIVKVKGF